MNYFIREHKIVIGLTLVGLCLRVVYTLFFSDYVALHYFHSSSLFTEDSDFKDWLISIQQLVETGTYTLNPENPYGYFGRMPGYAFFIGFFYYLFQSPYYLYAIGYSQVVLDSCNIFLLYCIYRHLFPSSRYSYFVAALYAFNPIAIFWAPTMYAESLSVFLLVLGIYVYVCIQRKPAPLITGLILGFDILVRPQIAIFVAVFIFYFVYQLIRSYHKTAVLKLCFFLFGISATYGLWPVRNYIFHHKIILTHDIRGINTWGPDVFAYMQYTFSIQTHWEPQFSQIVKNQHYVVDPTIAYAYPTDSADLAKAIFLSKQYGSGFSYWPEYWQHKHLEANSQDTVIVALFNKLHRHQIEYNAFHYWVLHPLKTLSKTLFKISMEANSTHFLASIGQLAFLWRTSLLLIALAGCYFWIKHSPHPLIYLIVFFFCAWHITISFGPPAYFRNIEMRYLLQTDTLMLIPAAFALEYFIVKMKKPSI